MIFIRPFSRFDENPVDNAVTVPVARAPLNGHESDPADAQIMGKPHQTVHVKSKKNFSRSHRRDFL